MLSVTGRRIYLACGHTDMRKSINGLSAIIESGFQLNPFDSALFVFCNRSRDRLKILEWDTDGFWIYFKRLEKGHFQWPTASDERTMTLSQDEFEHLIGSTKVIQKIRRKEVKIGLIT